MDTGDGAKRRKLEAEDGDVVAEVTEKTVHATRLDEKDPILCGSEEYLNRIGMGKRDVAVAAKVQAHEMSMAERISEHRARPEMCQQILGI